MQHSPGAPPRYAGAQTVVCRSATDSEPRLQAVITGRDIHAGFTVPSCGRASYRRKAWDATTVPDTETQLSTPFAARYRIGRQPDGSGQ